MGSEVPKPKGRSARRSWRDLFPEDNPTPTARSSPPPVPTTLPHSQSANNSTNLACPPAQEGKSSQQPRAGDPSPGIGTRSLANEGVQQVEEEKKASNGVQEKKTDLAASGPESTPLKTDVAAGDKKKGKGAGVRVWSLQDEVRILDCLAAFVKDNGAPPPRSQLPKVVHAHLLDKKEFTLSEIYEKVRRLRTTAAAAAAAGAPPPGNAEDLRKYELSRQIWGDSLLLPKREIGSGQERVRREFEELQDMYPHLTIVVEEITAAADRGSLKRAFEFIDDGTARQLDAKLKKQGILEMKIHRDRGSVRSEVLSTLMEYMA